jgi:hypothetical protein
MKRFNQNWDGVSRTNLTEATTQTLSKMDYRSATNTDVNGTSRVGRIEGMSVNDLIKVLGKPHRRTPSKPHTFGDGKSTVEWAFKRIGMTNKLGVKFDFVFTVYDYKNPPKDDNTKMVWSVGGKTKMDAYAIQQVLRVAGLKVIREEVEQGEGETEITEASYFKTIKTMNDLAKDAANGNRVIPKGVSIQKIIGGTQTWRTVKDSDDTKKAVASQAAEIKKIAHLVGNPDDKTIAFIAKIFISQMQHGKKESVEEAVRLGKGRPAGAMSPQALFMHKFDQLENDNAHGAAALLLAKFMGNSKAVKCIELVNKIHETEGSIPHLIQQYRDRWSERLWADFDKKYPNERSV